MLGKMYPSWIGRTVDGTDSYAGATFTALLMKQSYTWLSTHVFIADMGTAANELVIGTGNYQRVTPTGISISRTGSITTVTFNPIVFHLITATGTAAPWSMILAKVGPSDAASPLVLQQDFQAAQSVTNADITINASSAGFIRYTSSP